MRDLKGYPPRNYVLEHRVDKGFKRAVFRVVVKQRLLDLVRVEGLLDEVDLLLFVGASQTHLALHAHEARPRVTRQLVVHALVHLLDLLVVQFVAISEVDGRHSSFTFTTWNGIEWNGLEWNRIEWNGMEWNRME